MVAVGFPNLLQGRSIQEAADFPNLVHPLIAGLSRQAALENYLQQRPFNAHGQLY